MRKCPVSSRTRLSRSTIDPEFGVLESLAVVDAALLLLLEAVEVAGEAALLLAELFAVLNAALIGSVVPLVASETGVADAVLLSLAALDALTR